MARDTVASGSAIDRPSFKIYRGAAAQADSGFVWDWSDPEVQDWYSAYATAGAIDGVTLSHLVDVPGFSLVSAWFKSGFPAARHSHDADCLYYIISGSLTMGTETVAAGDSVFVAANTPYSFTAGPLGVELLEFRHKLDPSVRLLGSSQASWLRLAEQVAQRRSAWRIENRPTREL